MKQLSGKFVLRLDPKLHSSLQEFAKRRKLSLNQFCIERLLGNVGQGTEFGLALLEAISHALKIYGDELIGIVFFGSWARREQREGSDIDLLFVLEEGISIKRELYNQWEEIEENKNYSVQPSIVALPDGKQPISGFWAEISIDGIILFETSNQIHQYLLRVRQAIANGSLKRERSHGQNYWIHESQVA